MFKLQGTSRGCLKFSICGTNNQLPNIFYKFVHLQMINIKHKIVHLQVPWRQIFVFQKSCLLQTEKNGCLWTYGRASLVSGFKLIREKDDLLYLRHKQIFEVTHPVQEYTKNWILDKRYRTNTVRTFWGTQSTSALSYLGLDHFGRFCTKIYEIRLKS